MSANDALRRAASLSLIAAGLAACGYPNVELRLDDAQASDVVAQDSSSDSSAIDAGIDARIDASVDSAPDSMPDSMPDAAPTNCRMATYTPAQTALNGTSAGDGMTMMAFTNARDRATFACRMVCGQPCTVPANEMDNCHFDSGMNGYVCTSFCTLPPFVFQADAPGCSTNAACWRTAKDAANAACRAAGCPGTCTISTNADDQCEFFGSINGYRCRSTCVCP